MRSDRRPLRFPLFVAPLLLAVLGCRSPEPLPFPQPQTPISVEVNLVSESRDTATERLFEETLRDELAGLAEVLPTVEADPSFGLIRVTVEPLGRGEAVGETVGRVAVEMGGATLQVASGAGSAPASAVVLLVGTAVTVVSLPVTAAVSQTRAVTANVLLGYKPRHLRVRLHCFGPGPERPRYEYTTSAFELVKHLRPLTAEEVQQPGRLRQEEARALARFVAGHLTERGWARRSGPRLPPIGP